MSAYLEWVEPVAVRQWRWHTQELPEIKNMLRLFAKWSLLLGVPVLFFIYQTMPSELPQTAACFLALVVLQPMGVAAHVWSSRKECPRYSITGKGLRRRGGKGTRVFSWANIESYLIVEHQHLSGISVLEWKMKQSRTIHIWGFNTSQMDTQELKQAIENYMPLSRQAMR